MSRTTWAAGATALGLIVLAGCADNPMVLQGRVAQYQQQQSALQAQNGQYQSRIASLDRDNQQMKAQLAQQQQQTKLLEDRLTLVTEQLHSTTEKLAQVQGEKQEVDTRAKALTAGLRRQSGISITPNNSFAQTLPAVRYPNVHVRRDGDVIRIELPGNQLFEPGSARVRPAAMNMIADVAIEIRRTYPDQRVGIEGHTDSDPVTGGQYRTNHELSAARRWPSMTCWSTASVIGPSSFSSSATARITPWFPTARWKASSETGGSSWSSIPTGWDNRPGSAFPELPPL